MGAKGFGGSFRYIAPEYQTLGNAAWTALGSRADTYGTPPCSRKGRRRIHPGEWGRRWREAREAFEEEVAALTRELDAASGSDIEALAASIKAHTHAAGLGGPARDQRK